MAKDMNYLHHFYEGNGRKCKYIFMFPKKNHHTTPKVENDNK